MYGPLYGFFGGLFLNIYPTDIFLIHNIMLFCATIIVFLVDEANVWSCHCLYNGFDNYDFLHHSQIICFPWATSITACCTVLDLLHNITAAETHNQHAGAFHFDLAAVVVVAAYYARFSIEFITVCLPLLIYFAWEVYRTRRWWLTAREGMIFTGIVLMLLAPLLYGHYLRYGHPLKTKYSYIELRPGVPYQSLEALEPTKIFHSVGEVIFGIGYTDELYKPVLYESPVLVL